MQSPTSIREVEFFRAKSTGSIPIADATHRISEISFIITRITLESGVTGEAHLLSFHYSPRAIEGALMDVRHRFFNQMHRELCKESRYAQKIRLLHLRAQIERA